MNSHGLRKLTKVFAGVVFLVALGINVKVTLDDPFLILTEGVLAQSSSSSSCSTVSVSEAVRDRSRNGWKGREVEVEVTIETKKCVRLFWKKVKICRTKKDKVRRIKCDCVSGTKQDYCLY